ncbi:MAG: transposase [Desulfobacteraceae bacterium]|nr:transposase [Desulfobacteraceae bacterium]
MARANRHYIPGYVWHLTHRCHKREFLFKFAKDRLRWMQWLYEAKKKYHLIILDYMVTSNHTHLLVYDHVGADVIPKSIQLLAGRIGQEYNIRKKRKGAFWQDRYHATAVETGEHLRQCIVYIDLNMVRAGTINHPSQWYWCGYHEIQNSWRKNILIDYDKLGELAGYNTFDTFQAAHRKWIDDSLISFKNKRESQWTESIATGSNIFTNKIISQLGSRAKGRRILENGQTFQIREEMQSYNALFDGEKGNIAPENTLHWSEDA